MERVGNKAGRARGLKYAFAGGLLAVAIGFTSGIYLGVRLTEAAMTSSDLDVDVFSLNYLMSIHDLGTQHKAAAIESMVRSRIGLATLNVASFYPYLTGQERERAKRVLKRIRDSGIFGDDQSTQGKAVRKQISNILGTKE